MNGKFKSEERMDVYLYEVHGLSCGLKSDGQIFLDLLGGEWVSIDDCVGTDENLSNDGKENWFEYQGCDPLKENNVEDNELSCGFNTGGYKLVECRGCHYQ